MILYKIYKSITLMLLFFLYSQIEARPRGESYFIENKGQVNNIDGKPESDVLFVSETNGARVYFRENGISYVFKRLYNRNMPLGIVPDNLKPHPTDTMTISYHRIDVDFSGSSANPEITALDQVGGKLNVYNPNFPSGIEGISFYRKLIYKGIYPGVDIVFYINDRNSLKYDFIVNPGADPGNIKLKVFGADDIEIVDGNLKIVCPLGEISEIRPYSYQKISSLKNTSEIENIEISSKFILDGNTIRLDIGSYIQGTQLIIDPNVTWSSYYGGSEADHGYAVTVNKKDYVVLTGSTISNDFPVSPGAFQVKLAGSYDMYITYMDYDGNVIWTTLYGGSLNDYVYDITTGSDLSIYVGGWTWSPDFPLSPGSYQTAWGGDENDGIIIKFDSLGRRKWATFFGGNFTEHLYKIVCDNNDDIIATGWTNSTTFSKAPFATEPGAYQNSQNGAEDVFLVKFDSAGKYIWGTFMGSDSTEEALGLSLDQYDNIYITGSTKSSDFPVTPDAYSLYGSGLRDVFFAIFNASGQLLYSSLIGGYENDYGQGICVDSSQNFYIVGYTSSPDFPVTSGSLQTMLKGTGDALVMKFDKNRKMIWSTFYGSDAYDYSTSIITDRLNNIVITGRTFGNNLPVSVGALSDTISGPSDAFVTKFSFKDGKLIWGSYYGGIEDEIGRSLASDRFSNIYSTGSTLSPDFPMIDPPIQNNYGGLSDAYLLKQCVTEPNPFITTSGPLEFCQGGSVTLDAGSGYKLYRWSDGSTGRYLDAARDGDYFVAVWDENLCVAYSKPVHVTVFPAPDVRITGDKRMCFGEGTFLSADKDYVKYLWSTGDTTKQIFVDKLGFYELTVFNNFGCKNSDMVNVTYHPIVTSDITGPTKICANDPIKNYSIIKTNGNVFEWSAINGDIITGQNSKSIQVNWQTDKNTGIVVLRTVTDSTGCHDEDTIRVLIKKTFIPDITTSTGMRNICEGDTIKLIAEEGYQKYKWSTGETTREISVWSEGTYELQILDEGNCTGKNSIELKVYPKPKPVITGEKIICNLGADYVFSTPNHQGNSYSWVCRKGNISGDKSSNRIDISWDSKGADTLYVIETVDSTGCITVSEKYYVNIAGSPQFKIKYNSPLEFCQGDSVLLFINEDFTVGTWSDGSKGNSIVARTTGSYFINVVNEMGCTGTDTVKVKANPRPATPLILQSDDTLSTGNYMKYQWKEYGVDVPGANSSKFVPEKNGFYSVVVENLYGCISESESFYFEKLRAFSRISIKDKNLRDTILAGAGRNIKAILYLEESDNLRKFGATDFKAYIRFNKSLLLPIGSFKNHGANNHEKFIAIDGTTDEEKGILKEIEFSTALGDTECTIIHLDSVVWNSEIDVILDDGYFCLTDICETNGSIRRLVMQEDLFFYNVPNPVNNETEIVLNLSSGDYCNISVSDIMGNKIAGVIDEYKPPGKYSYFLNTDDISSGVYYLTLKTTTRIIVRKIEILK
jgi:hypothetical protein